MPLYTLYTRYLCLLALVSSLNLYSAEKLICNEKVSYIGSEYSVFERVDEIADLHVLIGDLNYAKIGSVLDLKLVLNCVNESDSYHAVKLHYQVKVLNEKNGNFHTFSCYSKLTRRRSWEHINHGRTGTWEDWFDFKTDCNFDGEPLISSTSFDSGYRPISGDGSSLGSSSSTSGGYGPDYRHSEYYTDPQNRGNGMNGRSSDPFQGERNHEGPDYRGGNGL